MIAHMNAHPSGHEPRVVRSRGVGGLLLLSFTLSFIHPAQAEPAAIETAPLPDGAGVALLDAKTAVPILARAVNAGQLSGRNPDGSDIEKVRNLLPLVVQSMFIRSDDGGGVWIDGNGVYSLKIETAGFSFLDDQGKPLGVVTSWTEAMNQVDWTKVTNLPSRGPLPSSPVSQGEIRPELGGTEAAVISLSRDGRNKAELSGIGILRVERLEVGRITIAGDTLSGASNISARSFTLNGVTLTNWPSGAASQDPAPKGIGPTVFRGPVYVAPAGDLGMGIYTNGPPPPP